MSTAWVWHASVWNIYMVEVHDSTKRLKHDRLTVWEYQMGVQAHVIAGKFHGAHFNVFLYC